MAIQPDGVVRGTASSHGSGAAEMEMREAHADDRSRAETSVVNDYLAMYGQTGSGTLKHPKPEDLDTAFDIESTFTLDPVASFPGPGAMKVPMGLAFAPIETLATDKPLASRKWPFSCGSSMAEQNYTIEFPRNVAIFHLPKGAAYENGGVAYKSKYVLKGRTVAVTRTLTQERTSRVCHDEDNQVWRELISVVQRDLRAQIVYR